ncbi:MAG: helix-turn-helix domain-containing protein [Solobacterium sp.]|nr:helix-turn-helix domain-containing protein [Solobacterium sp.]
MELKDIIRDYKYKTGFNDSEIARRLGVSRSTASRWASGQIRRVSPDVMARLSDMVGYNIEPMLKGMDISVKLPVLGFVKGGYDLFAEENHIGEEDASLSDCKRGDYYLQVTGNSMNGVGIMDGSLVLVQQTEKLSSGEIGVVMIDQEVTVKKVVLKKGMMILEAANPDVENRYFTSQEIQNLPVRIIGRVISAKTYF